MFMTFGRSSTLETGVVNLVAAGPEIVPSRKLGNRVGMWPLRSDWLAPDLAIVMVSLLISIREVTSLAWDAATSALSMLLVAVRANIEAQSLAVVVEILAIASTVSCW